MIKFLPGYRIYSSIKITEKQYSQIFETFKELNIHTGIFEMYEESMSYLSTVLDVNWPEEIDVKRVTLNRPKISEIDQGILEKLRQQNTWYFMFYDHFKTKLESRNLKGLTIRFKKERYDYV